jgi:PAS domain S-box-containing protein
MQFQFHDEQFSAIFPFYVLIDRDMKIKAIGSSLKKILGPPDNILFNDYLKFKTPYIPYIKTIADIERIKGQFIVLETVGAENILLKGQFLSFDDRSCLFIGNPWFGSMAQVAKLNLESNDFAKHDPHLDLLHLLQIQENAAQETKHLLVKVSEQQTKLEESEANYRTIVESASQIIYKINAEGTITFSNSAIEKITGYSKTELLTMNYLQLIRPDFRKKTGELYHDQIETGLEITSIELPIIDRSGMERWLQQNMRYSLNGKGEVELTSVAVDITEEKVAKMNLLMQEEKYQSIISNMNIGVVEVDMEYKITYVNDGLCKMSGYTKEELLGKEALNMLPPDAKKELMGGDQNIRKGISDQYSIPFINKSGKKRFWLISWGPEFNRDGQIIGWMGVQLDITNQKLLEKELYEAKEKAEESTKAKERFLATMSHEIRTPLNAIIGITDLMQFDSKTRSDENFNILKFSSRHLLSLITDILDLSKIEAGKIAIENKALSLRNLLSGIIRMFKSGCDEKGIELILDIDDSVPDNILADELRLSQILINLISNAVKFTHIGYIVVSVSAVMTEAAKAQFTFKILDSGMGIEKDKIRTIFNSFEQAGNFISRAYGGTGLGLSITKKLIELMGGSIKIKSKINKGTTVTFSLQYQVTKQKNGLLKNKEKDLKQSLEQTDFTGKTILLVEDNIINQKVAGLYFDQWGLSYNIAPNGAQALELLDKKHYDIALIDLFMPIMDGFETITRIKKNEATKDLKIIALTASAELSIIEKAIKLGADECLTKPFNPHQLRAAIGRYTGAGKTIGEKADGHLSNDSNARTKIIDLSRIESASLGSKQFILDLLSLILDQTNQMMETARENLAGKDAAKFGAIMHKMRSNIMMLGMDDLRADFVFIEEKPKDNSTTAEFTAPFMKIKSTWEKAVPEISELILQLEAANISK